MHPVEVSVTVRYIWYTGLVGFVNVTVVEYDVDVLNEITPAFEELHAYI